MLKDILLKVMRPVGDEASLWPEGGWARAGALASQIRSDYGIWETLSFPFFFVDTEHLPRAKHCAEAVGMQRRYGTGPALSFRRGRRGRWTRSAGQPGGWRGCACPWLRTEDRRKGARPPRGSTLEQSSLTLPNVTQGKS